MRQNELTIGHTYILASPRGQVAVYEGRHPGTALLADGSTLVVAAGNLRFRYTDSEGVERVVLFETAREVEESTATRDAREEEKRRSDAAKEAALAEASALVKGLGFDVVDSIYRFGDAATTMVGIRANSEHVDDLSVEGITVGKLKAMLAAAK